MGFLHVSEAATTARRALLESCDSTGGSDACRHVPVVVPEAPGDCELSEPVRLLRHPPDTAPPLARRAPDSLGEECTEGPQTGEAHVEAHLGDRATPGGEQRLGAVHPHADEVLVRRGAKRLAEETQEVISRESRLACQFGQRERLGLVLVQVVTREGEAAEDVVVDGPPCAKTTTAARLGQPVALCG